MKSRMNPKINAGTMADVAFLLLLFFLVATSIENPKGIQVLLPPYEPSPPIQLPENRVLTVKINKSNQVMVESKFCRVEEVSELVSEHIMNRLDEKIQPIVSIVTDTSAKYNTYIEVYDEIKSAYTKLRDEAAQALFAKDYVYLEKSKKKIIIDKIPMIISEADYY